MGKLGIKPDVVTYGTLISAFYKNNRREIGDGLWNLMRLRGINPNLTTYNVRIQYLIHHCRTFEANDLVRSMGCELNERIYQTMIHYLCEERDFDLGFRLCKKSMQRICIQVWIRLGN
ncbi:hypothetical protein LUZ60_003312 [Juncus effusus]|nr:hypothetical protein LUZ60_003312 [Juncus effusus]